MTDVVEPCCLLYRQHYPQDHEWDCPLAIGFRAGNQEGTSTMNHLQLEVTETSASLVVADERLTVEYTGERDLDRAAIYRWTVIGHTATDLYGPATGEVNPLDTLRALLSFLGAAAEGGENGDLFPGEVVEWAAQNSDEIACASMEMEEVR